MRTEAPTGRGETCRLMSAAGGGSGDRVLASIEINDGGGRPDGGGGRTGGAVAGVAEPATALTREVPGLVRVVAANYHVLAGARQPRVRRRLQVGATDSWPPPQRHTPHTHRHFYRTVGVANRLELRSVTCDNAQLPMLNEPCSCWPVAARVGSGH